jgi:hypothetical protein
MLAAVVVCLCIAVVRISLAAATVPYALYVSKAKTAEAKAAGLPTPKVTVPERIAASGPFASWWGGRRVPRPVGGNYLGVLSQNSVIRSLGCAIGVVTERLRAEGVVVERVIVPSDDIALYGTEVGSPMVRADGTQYLSGWGSLQSKSAYFSSVPVEAKAYDPMLSAEQGARIVAESGLAERSTALYVAGSRAGASGTWILLVRVRDRREFLLVPVESSPVGGAL